jgi:hypothetical protein
LWKFQHQTLETWPPTSWFPVVNHGFGGSQLADSVNFADRIITPCQPRQV